MNPTQVPSVPVFTGNHREFNRACKQRARLVRIFPNAQPGSRLRFSDRTYEVQPNGSFRKVWQESFADRRFQRRARWSDAIAERKGAA